MNVLLIGTDRTALDTESSLSRRLRSYGSMVDKFTVIVPHKQGRFGALLEIKKRATEYLRDERVDVISTRDIYFLGFLVVKLAKYFNTALEVQVHGIEKMSWFRIMLAQYVLKKANSIRVVSERLKKMLVREFGVSADRIVVAPIYTDWEKLQNESPKFDLRERYPDSFIFLTVGRLVPIKNIGLQIEAMKKMNPRVVLIIVGGGPEEQNLKKLITKNKLDGKVVIVGKTDDVVSYYKGSDCLLLTSNYEGWGLVAVEAASVGLPIIMTDVGLAGEAILHGPDTRVIPVGDMEALTREMRVMVERGRHNHVPFGDVHDRLMPQSETLRKVNESWQTADQNHERH